MTRHLVFRADRERYALPLPAVREVVMLGPLSAVPRAPGAVRGIMNLRGRIVTVVDLKLLLALRPSTGSTSSASGRLVVLDRERRDLGLLVDEIVGIVELENLAPVPDGGPSIRGVATMPGQEGPGSVATVLDADGVDAQIASLFGAP